MFFGNARGTDVFFRFEKSCKDPMIHEALLDAISERKIAFRINGDAEGYQQVLLEKGILVVQCKRDRFWTNIDAIRNTKIEELIPSDGNQ